MQIEYVLSQKSSLKKINIADIDYPLPDLKNSDSSKATIIAKWFMEWIDDGFANNKFADKSLLPIKSELAYFLGVSVGTVQNALRYIEDLGYVESKQRIGTLIKSRESANSRFRKLTSKREIAINEIKKFISDNKLKSGDTLPSSRALSTLIGCSANTTRLALEYLCAAKILKHCKKNSNDSGWEIISSDFAPNQRANAVAQKTLVNKVEHDLKNYINTTLKVGEQLPPHAELSKLMKVSIKTVHDALKTLVDEGILLTRRGRYGTTVIKLPKDIHNSNKLEKSIFAPAKDTAFYYYEKTQNAIKTMIAEHYDIGSKLPSILELSKEMDLSPNTIRKAFHNLAKEGYLVFSRGRYGGTFVVDIPQTGEETFKWIAVNPHYTVVKN